MPQGSATTSHHAANMTQVSVYMLKHMVINFQVSICSKMWKEFSIRRRLLTPSLWMLNFPQLCLMGMSRGMIRCMLIPCGVSFALASE